MGCEPGANNFSGTIDVANGFRGGGRGGRPERPPPPPLPRRTSQSEATIGGGGMIPSRKSPPDRLSNLDYISSLARSRAYQDSYADFVSGKNAEETFLRQWLKLKNPIPPQDARKNPSAFLDHIVPPVLGETELPRSWFEDGKLSRLPGMAEGLYLPIWVDFNATKKEILRLIGHRIDEYSFLSVSRPEKRDRGIGRWEVWDTFQGKGKKSARKTAELLFPKEFQYKKDKEELREETKKEYKKRIDGGEKMQKAMHWHDTRVEKGKAPLHRLEARKRSVEYVKGVIRSCQRMIDYHEQPREIKIHEIPKDFQWRPMKK